MKSPPPAHQVSVRRLNRLPLAIVAGVLFLFFALMVWADHRRAARFQSDKDTHGEIASAEGQTLIDSLVRRYKQTLAPKISDPPTLTAIRPETYARPNALNLVSPPQDPDVEAAWAALNNQQEASFSAERFWDQVRQGTLSDQALLEALRRGDVSAQELFAAIKREHANPELALKAVRRRDIPPETLFEALKRGDVALSDIWAGVRRGDVAPKDIQDALDRRQLSTEEIEAALKAQQVSPEDLLAQALTPSAVWKAVRSGQMSVEDVFRAVRRGELAPSEIFEALKRGDISAEQLFEAVKRGDISAEQLFEAVKRGDVSAEQLFEAVKRGDISTEQIFEAVKRGDVSAEQLFEAVKRGDISAEQLFEAVKRGDVSAEQLFEAVKRGDISAEQLFEAVKRGDISAEQLFEAVKRGDISMAQLFEAVKRGDITSDQLLDAIQRGDVSPGQLLLDAVKLGELPEDVLFDAVKRGDLSPEDLFDAVKRGDLPGDTIMKAVRRGDLSAKEVQLALRQNNLPLGALTDEPPQTFRSPKGIPNNPASVRSGPVRAGPNPIKRPPAPAPAGAQPGSSAYAKEILEKALKKRLERVFQAAQANTGVKLEPEDQPGGRASPRFPSPHDRLAALSAQTNPLDQYQERMKLMQQAVGTAMPATGESAPQNKGDYDQFDAPSEDRFRLNARVEAQSNPYLLHAGYVIPATLLTSINSDIPGVIRGHVSSHIYDSTTGQYLLIPQGTQLYGRYDSGVIYGQSRVLIAWQRLQFPDGSTLDIGAMPGAGANGASGFGDKVNHHYFRIFSSAILLSGIAAGPALAQREQPNNPFAQSLGQNLQIAASRMVERNLSIAPTIEIRTGFQFNVVVTKDLEFPGPYVNP